MLTCQCFRHVGQQSSVCWKVLRVLQQSFISVEGPRSHPAFFQAVRRAGQLACYDCTAARIFCRTGGPGNVKAAV
jgi:hypothetical protein